MGSKKEDDVLRSLSKAYLNHDNKGEAFGNPGSPQLPRAGRGAGSSYADALWQVRVSALNRLAFCRTMKGELVTSPRPNYGRAPGLYTEPSGDKSCKIRYF